MARNVLIVDDMPVNLMILQGLLESRGLKVDTAISGEECLALFGSKTYDLVFLDYRMPGMDGIETFHKLRELSEGEFSTPVVALTGNEGEGVAETFLNEGFFEYLRKPVDPVVLDKIIQELSLDAEPAENVSSKDTQLPPELYDIKQLNLKVGIHHCGTIDAYINALMIFCESAKGRQAELKAAFDEHRLDKISHITHALKSTAGAIGAISLSELSAWIENSADTGETDTVYEKTPILLDNYKELGEKLARVFNTKDEYFPDDESYPEITREKLSDAYLTLGECLGFYDYGSINIILESLREYHIPKADREKLDEFHRAASVFDRNKMRQIIDEYFSESEKK